MPDNTPTPPSPTGNPIRISDEHLLPFLTALRMRELQQPHIIDSGAILLYPWPDCPACGQAIRDAQFRGRDRLRLASSTVDLVLQPCGHWFTTTEGTIDRLMPYALDAATNLDNHIPEPRPAAPTVTPEQITDALGIDRLTNWPDVLAAARRLGQEHRHQREVIASVCRLTDTVLDVLARHQAPAEPPTVGIVTTLPPGCRPPAAPWGLDSLMTGPIRWVSGIPTAAAGDCSAGLLSLDGAIRPCVIKGPHIGHQAADGTRWTRPEDLDDVTDVPFLTRRPTTPEDNNRA